MNREHVPSWQSDDRRIRYEDSSEKVNRHLKAEKGGRRLHDQRGLPLFQAAYWLSILSRRH